jgi:TonB family protein
VEPEYSEEALNAKYQGAVLLYVQVDPSGKAVNMRVLHSLGMGLDEKAMEAVPRHCPRILEHIPPERVIGRINSSVAWSRLFTGMAAATATRRQETVSNETGTVNVYGEGGTATGTYSGTTTSTAQVPDEQQRQRIWQAQREREQQAYNWAQSVASSSLRSTTLTPGREIHGLVYFRRERSCAGRDGCSILLTVPVGDTTFEFPVEFGSRRKP